MFRNNKVVDSNSVSLLQISKKNESNLLNWRHLDDLTNICWLLRNLAEANCGMLRDWPFFRLYKTFSRTQSYPMIIFPDLPKSQVMVFLTIIAVRQLQSLRWPALVSFVLKLDVVWLNPIDHFPAPVWKHDQLGPILSCFQCTIEADGWALPIAVHFW